jgi:ATP-binding protein involved in chromosome partitioning
MNIPLALSQQQLADLLDTIRDPLTGAGLVSAGRISGLAAREDGKVSFTIEAPRDAAARYHAVRDAAEAALRAAPGVSAVTAVLTAHEAPAPAPAHKRSGLADVGAVIAVASAKGGVGKSTVAVNLACAFAALGKRAGLLDLDVYGPSAPTLLGLAGAKPQPGPNDTIEPIEAFGLKTMSVGYLVDPASPMVWRGAMATNAARQMLDEVNWGGLDVLVLDLPPGTGDVQLTLVQRVQLAGAIIVSTPQELALADVRRGIAMFEKTHAPILGIVENMAWFEDAAGARTYIFGQGGAQRIARECGAPFLGEIPIHVALREACDAGAPFVAAKPEHPISGIFMSIAATALDNAARMQRPAPRIAVT